MGIRAALAFVTWTLVMLAVGGASAGDATASLAKKLAEFKGAERGQIIPVADDAVARAFPGYRVYVLRFRQYPIALVPPAPLASNNLFIVKPDGSVEHIPDAEALKEFFRTTLAPVRVEIAAGNAVKAWLRLVQEFHQDGLFRFAVPDDSIRIAAAADGGLHVTGRAVVNPNGGNAGDIVGSLTFNATGDLVRVSEAANHKRGIRPICQATKLLDADPIVRGMAEQAILVMGRETKEYLDEVRAKANTELKAAIDRIWQRILAEDR
jgi:hypothetical protein